MSIERIRAALAAGPTPGPWSLETDSGFNYRDINYGVGAPVPYYWVVPTLDIPKEDAAFIAACYPEAIRELLAERDALKAENASLREMLAHLYAGSDLYSDDGELQDARAEPFIDFKRDSVADIRCAMVERNERKEQR